MTDPCAPLPHGIERVECFFRGNVYIGRVKLALPKRTTVQEAIRDYDWCIIHLNRNLRKLHNPENEYKDAAGELIDNPEVRAIIGKRAGGCDNNKPSCRNATPAQKKPRRADFQYEDLSDYDENSGCLYACAAAACDGQVTSDNCRMLRAWCAYYARLEAALQVNQHGRPAPRAHARTMPIE